MDKEREQKLMDAMVRGGEPVDCGNGLKLWPVSFGTLMALRKLGNAMVQDFMEGRELKMDDFEAMAQFFWAHTRPWDVVHAHVRQAMASGRMQLIDAEVFELAGVLTAENTRRMMKLLGEMQKEARAAQVEVIPDVRHKEDAAAPKN
jgi:hypothetical protein